MSFRVPSDSSDISDDSEPTFPEHHPTPPLALPPPPSTMSELKKTPWPKWSGAVEDYPFFHTRLECRIAEGASDLSQKMICYRMVETLPEKKPKLVANWFNTGGKNKDWNWKEFLKHFALQFEDKQAKRAASDELSRMRQGATQLFSDFVSDFEYKLAIAGGSDWPADVRLSYVHAGINTALRTALVTMALPENDYDEWMTAVKLVAGKLENLATYRQKGSTVQNKTWLLRQPGTIGYHPSAESSAPKTDHQGDTIMGGTDINAIVTAVVNAMNKGKSNSRGSSDSRPRAPWRTPKAFKRLLDQGVCSRCEKP